MKQDNQSESDLLVINSRLEAGAVDRAGYVCLIMAIAYLAYGFTSISILNKFDPNITLWSNTWPRLVFNTVPCITYFLLSRNSVKYAKEKLWLWVGLFPTVFFAACMIHVWPLINAGNSDLFLYVHGANLFTFTISLVVAAPPLKYSLTTAAFYLGGLFAGMGYMLTRWNALIVRDLLFGDNFIAGTSAIIVAYLIHKLRYKVAVAELEQKKRAKPFLGEALAEAIYNNSSDFLEAKQRNSMVLMIDIRNFTKFAKSTNDIEVSKFTNDFHATVTRIVGENNGFCHKSSGDGYMVSFGAFESAPDLSDLEGIDNELKIAERRRAQDRMERLLKTAFRLSLEFELLKIKHAVPVPISLGMGAAEGFVTVSVVGDGKYRSELDINGTVVIKAARLEQYTKVIRESVAPNDSVLVLGPEFAQFMQPEDRIFKMWLTMEESRMVKDFPDIQYVFYHSFRNANERRQNIRKLSAA